MNELEELQEKFETKQADLAKVFDEAKTDDGGYDYRNVKCLGKEFEGKSIAVAERVKEMDTELNEIGQQVETLRAADEAAKAHKSRENTLLMPPHANAGKPAGVDVKARLAAIGELAAADVKFKQFMAEGSKGHVTLKFDDVLPSDWLAKAGQSQTIGTKTLFQTSAGYDPESFRLPGFVEGVTRPIQLLDIIPLQRTGSDTIKYMEETTRTHAAAEKAEGGTFAESTFEFTEQTSPVQKITDSVPVTDEQLEDVAMIQSYLEGRINFGIRQRFDSQALIGNGTSPNLRGLKNVSGIQTQARGTDPIPDAFYKAMTKIRVTGRSIPTHHVIHPTDWQNVRLLRTADGVYIWGAPSESGPDRMWGLPVAQNDADSAGTGYTGSFLPAHVSAFERRGVDIQIGYVSTQFVEGKRTIRGDIRVALVFFRPVAFCSVTGLTL